MRMACHSCQAEGATGTPTESLLGERAEVWCRWAPQPSNLYTKLSRLRLGFGSQSAERRENRREPISAVLRIRAAANRNDCFAVGLPRVPQSSKPENRSRAEASGERE